MKQPLIINIRGNSGSGKTHLTREFMERCSNGRIRPEPLLEADTNKILGYTMWLGKARWAVLGKYANACGGCDTIKTQQDVINRVRLFVAGGYNVWLEGLIMSTIYGAVGEYSEQFGDRWVFAYLDTPIETCIKRIKQRRKEAGNREPLNETNTRNRVKSILRNREIVLEHGRRVIDLSHKAALQQLLPIIRKEQLLASQR